ncbi:hypothetical protein PUR71_24560 [Streptomyces sp. SP17BM10]|uniref:hypothetical protein n=1 Tax=Streptomyces sp. SP17BM10 TaxID=3002530 RepID=UPI002E79B08F|nr:hypothetical protein [Streptomyces sp. SP17BM10]MEE1786044.1 hypothetical protein [Streptomyces sp. SP17BM10]
MPPALADSPPAGVGAGSGDGAGVTAGGETGRRFGAAGTDGDGEDVCGRATTDTSSPAPGPHIARTDAISATVPSAAAAHVHRERVGAGTAGGGTSGGGGGTDV